MATPDITTLFPYIKPKPIPEIEDITNLADDDNSTESLVSLVGLIITLIMSFFTSGFMIYQYNKLGSRNIPTFSFILLTVSIIGVLASSVSINLEKKFEDSPKDKSSKSLIYKQRKNQIIAYSITALVFTLSYFYYYYIKKSFQRTHSVIGFFSGAILNLFFIGTLSYFVYKFISDKYKDTSNSPSYVGLGVVLLIYSVITLFYNLVLSDGIQTPETTGLIITLALSIYLLYIGVTDDKQIPKFNVYGSGIFPSSYYKCKPLNINKKIVDWGNDDVKLNFDIKLTALSSDTTLVSCLNDNGDTSWKIFYKKDTNSITLDYFGTEISLLIDEDMINTNITKSPTAAPVAAAPTAAPVTAAPVTTTAPVTAAPTKAPTFSPGTYFNLNVTMIVRTYKEFNSNVGTVIFYHNNKESQYITENSMYIEKIKSPAEWGEILEVENYDTIENLQYCTKTTKPTNLIGLGGNLKTNIIIGACIGGVLGGILGMTSSYREKPINVVINVVIGSIIGSLIGSILSEESEKIVYVIFFSIVMTAVVLTFINPEVRKGIFGSSFFSFSAGNTFDKLIN